MVNRKEYSNKKRKRSSVKRFLDYILKKMSQRDKPHMPSTSYGEPALGKSLTLNP